MFLSVTVYVSIYSKESAVGVIYVEYTVHLTFKHYHNYYECSILLNLRNVKLWNGNNFVCWDFIVAVELAGIYNENTDFVQTDIMQGKMCLNILYRFLSFVQIQK
jgi:hypothetical protein